jgi:membrane protein DedA with SNARE-associated domain
VGSLDVQHLVHEYGCLLVFVAVALQALGLPVPGTTVLIAAALYAAAENGLPIVAVVAAGGIGALAGATAAFGIVCNGFGASSPRTAWRGCSSAGSSADCAT